MMKRILGLGIFFVFLLIILGFANILQWAIVGVLSAATLGILGLIINYLPKPREKTIPSEGIEKKTEHEQPKQPRALALS